MRRKLVDDRAAGVAIAQELGHFVEGLARGVVARPAEQAVQKTLTDFEQVGVPAAHHQRHGGEFHGVPARLASRNHGMNVALDGLRAMSGTPVAKLSDLGVSEGPPGGEPTSQARRWRRGGEVFELWCRRDPELPRTTGTMARRCSREASSGTTPPYLPWVIICEATTEERTVSRLGPRRRGFVAGGFDAEDAHLLLP